MAKNLIKFRAPTGHAHFKPKIPKYKLCNPKQSRANALATRIVKLDFFKFIIKTVKFGEGFSIFNFDHFEGFTVFNSSQPVFKFSGRIKVSV